MVAAWTGAASPDLYKNYDPEIDFFQKCLEDRIRSSELDPEVLRKQKQRRVLRTLSGLSLQPDTATSLEDGAKHSSLEDWFWSGAG